MVAAWTTKLPFMLRNWHSFPVTYSSVLLCVYSHAQVRINSWQCVWERVWLFVCVCGGSACQWAVIDLYHWGCSNPFLCLCLTDLPVYTAAVRAAAAVSQGSSSLRSGSLAPHTLTESAGHPSEDNRREDEQETDFKTEEGDKLSDIMSTRQMSIKERWVYESIKYPKSHLWRVCEVYDVLIWKEVSRMSYVSVFPCIGKCILIDVYWKPISFYLCIKQDIAGIDFSVCVFHFDYLGKVGCTCFVCLLNICQFNHSI